MKIWIVTSWFEMLPLFKFLNKYDIEYHIFWDWNNWPYGDKNFQYSMDNIQKWVCVLEKEKVDLLLLPPIYEIAYPDDGKGLLKLFQKYMKTICLKYSIIGKIGFIWDYADLQDIEARFLKLSEDYVLTENQSKIKKFCKPFAIRCKEVGLWKYYLTKLWFRDRMVRKTIKNDLRYFKDAWVDTIIPLNYGYFAYEKIIRSKLNFNKCRFHGIDKLEVCFDELIRQAGYKWGIVDQREINNQMKITDSKKDNLSKKPYLSKDWKKWVILYTNGSDEFLKREKKWMQILEGCGNVKIFISS